MAVLAPAAHSPPAESCQRHRQWEPACAAPRAPSTVLTLYEDPEGRHPVSFLGLPLVSHPVPLHQLCDLKLAPQGPTSNTAAGELGVRVQSVAHEGFRGGLWTLTCLTGFSSHPALLLVPSLSSPCPLPCSCCQCLVSGTILGTEQRPANSRGREAEKEQVTSGKRASERGDGRGAAGPGRVEGGLSAGDSGGWGARWGDQQDEHTARRP